MKIRPLGDHVVVQVVEEEKTTASGIVLPDTVDKKEKAQGKVMAIGTGKMLKDGSRAAIEVKVGDVVLFKKWGGDEVEVDGEEYKIVSSEDILAVIEK